MKNFWWLVAGVYVYGVWMTRKQGTVAGSPDGLLAMDSGVSADYDRNAAKLTGSRV